MIPRARNDQVKAEAALSAIHYGALSERIDLLLDDTGFNTCHFAVAPGNEIAWWQYYTDSYHLAGDEAFITDVVRSSFKTSLEYYLSQAREIEHVLPSSHASMKQACRRYEEFFPGGVPKLADVSELRFDPSAMALVWSRSVMDEG